MCASAFRSSAARDIYIQQIKHILRTGLSFLLSSLNGRRWQFFSSFIHTHTNEKETSDWTTFKTCSCINNMTPNCLTLNAISLVSLKWIGFILNHSDLQNATPWLPISLKSSCTRQWVGHFNHRYFINFFGNVSIIRREENHRESSGRQCPFHEHWLGRTDAQSLIGLYPCIRLYFHFCWTPYWRKE